MSKHDYGGISVSGGTNAFGFGEGHNIYQTIAGSPLEDSTSNLLKGLKQEEEKIPKEDIAKLYQLIEGITEESKSENPKKFQVSSMLDSFNKVVTTLAFSPKVDEGISFWVEQVKSFFGI